MKYYVVFKGFNPGVYDKWDDAREQIEGFPGGMVKSFSSASEAANAYRKAEGIEDAKEMRNFFRQLGEKTGPGSSSESNPLIKQPRSVWPAEIDADAWAVDASCLGNPGTMEYRGVDLASGKVIFTVGPFKDATNNIGEFLAIVHAMALMAKTGVYHNIYSDSKTGMSWVKNKKVKTLLKPTSENSKVFELMARAVTWLHTHSFPAKILKWETEKWGEIPADFGRK